MTSTCVNAFLLYADASLTADNVGKVMELVTTDNRTKIWRLTIEPLVEMIGGQLSTTKEKTEACVDLYLNCSPSPSWRDITSVLYNYGEMDAARKAKSFYQHGKLQCDRFNKLAYFYITSPCNA